jgi:hypothetical protein
MSVPSFATTPNTGVPPDAIQRWVSGAVGCLFGLAIIPIPLGIGYNVRTGLVAVALLLAFWRRFPILDVLTSRIGRVPFYLLPFGILLYGGATTALLTPHDYVHRGLADVLLLTSQVATMTVIYAAYVGDFLSLRDFVSGFIVSLAILAGLGVHDLLRAISELPSITPDIKMKYDPRLILRPPGFGTVMGTLFSAAAAMLVGRQFLVRSVGAGAIFALQAVVVIAGLTLSFSRAPLAALVLASGIFYFAVRTSLAKVAQLRYWGAVAGFAAGGYYGQYYAGEYLEAMFIKVIEKLPGGLDGYVSWRFQFLITGTWRDRLQLWKEISRDILHQPLFGHGFAAYRPYIANTGMTTSETFVLELVHAGGLVLVALLGFVLAALWRRSHAATATSLLESYAPGFFLAALTMGISGQTNPSCWISTFWALLAVALAAGPGVLRREAG